MDSLFNHTLFRKKSAKDMTQQAIEESQRRLLVHEDAAVYHSKMAEYYRDGIQRLQGPAELPTKRAFP